MSGLPALLVLGAGLSQRFGEADKLDQDLGGQPVALHALATLAGFPWAARLLVCRPAAPWAEAYRHAGFELVINDQPEGGMLWSLHLGVTQAEGAAAVLVALADMPLVTADHIHRLLDSFHQNPGQAVATSGGGYLGPPAIFPRQALCGLPRQGEGGARSLLGTALRVPIEGPLRADIDTVEGLEQVRRQLSPAVGR